MGVKACYRNTCENVGCDRYSNKYGYICDECFDELVSSGSTTDIGIFMSTVKNDTKIEEANVRYNDAFPLS